jgi:hypothetical protein
MTVKNFRIVKRVMALGTGISDIKLFFNLSNVCNKLECLYLAGLSSLVYSSRVRTGAYSRVEHLKGTDIRELGL